MILNFRMQLWTKRKLFATIFLLFFSSSTIAFTLKQLLENQIDPTLKYRSIETAHFEIHYSEDLSELAASIATQVEDIHNRVTHNMGSQFEEKTNIVIVHKSDETSVYTFVFPHRQIFLDAALPHYGLGLSDFNGWHNWVLTHEFTHVVHLENRDGLYDLLSPIFGSWMRPNQLQPAWVKEGLAVMFETQLTNRGRGDSSTYKMMTRMAAYEGLLNDPNFVAPDSIANFDNKFWPWTLRPYLFGYHLMKTLEDESGHPIGEFVRANSSSFPTRLNPGLKSIGIGSFQDLWDKTLKSLNEKAQSEIQKLLLKPLTPLEYMTNTGFYHFDPEISPDGKTLIVTYDRPTEENEILQFSLDENAWSPPRTLTNRSTGYQSAFSKSGRFLAFDQSAHSLRYYLISDIQLYDLKTKAFVGASPFLGARDPTIHPDGKHLAFVVNQMGKNLLVETDTSWQNQVILIGDVGYRRLTAPRYSPNGESIVLSAHNEVDGGEDLWLVHDHQITVLLQDAHQNMFPQWTSDGKKILFTSDRTGVSNVFALDLQSGDIHQMSHVLGGLFYPVADPKLEWVYVSSYRGKGYDLARFAFTF